MYEFDEQIILNQQILFWQLINFHLIYYESISDKIKLITIAYCNLFKYFDRTVLFLITTRNIKNFFDTLI